MDIRAELAQIQARTRVIVGREDQMVPRALSQVLADEIPDATLSVIDAGHLIPMEQPMELARVIAEFVG